MSSTPEAGPSSNGSSPVELSGPALSRFIWRAKYRAAGEASLADSRRRLAQAAASVEADPASWEAAFAEALTDFRFLPGGRIQAGAGRTGASLFNCFVLPGPSEGGRTAMAALEAAVVTLRAGGGVGVDFSHAAPSGWPDGEGPPAPGPVAYLQLWDAACRTVLARAPRQGAMMGVLRCDHPDIEAFAAAKRAPGVLSRFNLSVAVTDAFMAAVRADAAWALRFPAGPGSRPARRLPARALWDQILRCAYESGDPGVLFIDRINQDNNLAGFEQIAAANPCGEIPLPAYGACDLGSLNLSAFVRNPFSPRARLDLDALARTTRIGVRLLDNAIDLSSFPLPEQRAQARASRRIGLGVTGLADALLMLGLRYDEAAAQRRAGEVMQLVRDAAYGASVELAQEKGAFPLFDRDQYLQRPFVARLPAELREAIARGGIRNSHLIAIAPTGSISLLAGGVSSGLEPIFAAVQLRRIRDAEGRIRPVRILDPAVASWRKLRGQGAGEPPGFVAAQELAPGAHLEMQAALQPFVDNAISKTINVAADLPFESFRAVYDQAYDRGLKGCTIYRATAAAVLTPGGGCGRRRGRDGSA